MIDSTEPIHNIKTKKRLPTLGQPYLSPHLPTTLLLAILGFNILLYDVSFGIGTGIFWSLLNICAFINLQKEKRKTLSVVTLLIGVITGLLVGFRANGFVQFVNIASSLFSFTILILINANDKIIWKSWWLVKRLFRFALNSLSQEKKINKLIGSKKAGEKNKFLSLIKTLLLSFILLLFFTAILSAADPIFAKMVSNLVRQSVGRIILSFILTAILTVYFTWQFTDTLETKPKLSFFSFQDIFISITSLVVLFAIFLGVQSQYLFASHEVFKSFDITYSDYVRKGFFELIIASLLGGLISYLIILKARVLKDQSKKGKLTVINTFLVFELFALLLSALKRDLMYIEVFGLTRTRIIGEIFLFWVSGSLIFLLLLNCNKYVKEKQFIAGITIVTFTVVVFLNVFNMDSYIANKIPSRHRQKIDLFYITLLSEDAYSTWESTIPLAEEIFKDLKTKSNLTDEEKSQLANIKLALILLSEKKDRLIKKYDSSDSVFNKYFSDNYDDIPEYLKTTRKLQSYNFTEYKVFKSMQENTDLFETRLDKLISEIEKYQTEKQIYLTKELRWILYEFDYPFIDRSKMGKTQSRAFEVELENNYPTPW